MSLNPTLYKFQITSCKNTPTNLQQSNFHKEKTQSYEKTVHHNKITTIIYVPSGGGLTQRIFPKDKQQIQSKLKFIKMKNLTWNTAIYFLMLKKEMTNKKKFLFKISFMFCWRMEKNIKNNKNKIELKHKINYTTFGEKNNGKTTMNC